MKLFRFDQEVGREITAYSSTSLIMCKIATLMDAHVGMMHIGKQGVVGYHQAVTPQLFLVVNGAGWVRGESEVRTPIQVGQAAFWGAGEWHESGSDTGMMALVIESESLDSASWSTL